MSPDGPAIDVWIADAASPAWGVPDAGDETAPERLSAIGRALDAAVRNQGGPLGPCNLSHSGRHVVFVAARSPDVTHLGVDVEVRRDVPRPQAFARRILADGEGGAADLVGAWTVKEAALKATRQGLEGDPRAWRFDDLGRPNPRLLDAPAAWGPVANWAFLREEIADGVVLAIAVRLDKIHSLEVRLRSVQGPSDVSVAERCSSRCLRWSPAPAPVCR